MRKLILATAACAMIFASCQKKEDTEPIDVSKTTYLMDGKWQLKAFTWLPDINDTNAFPVDQYTPIPGCQKDNYFIFNSTTRTTRYEGVTKCNIADPDSIVYGYVLSNNDNHLQIYTNPDENDHNVELEGEVTYPSIDTFIVTYLKPSPQDSTKTSRYVKTYVKGSY